MTSNVGGRLILDHQGTNQELREKVQSALQDEFRPEFLNRIDDVVVFDPLTREDLLGIADIQLRQLGRLLAHRRIVIDVSPEAREHIVELGYEPSFGARPLKRVILKQLQDPLAEELLRGGYSPGDRIRVAFGDNAFSFTKA